MRRLLKFLIPRILALKKWHSVQEVIEKVARGRVLAQSSTSLKSVHNSRRRMGEEQETTSCWPRKLKPETLQEKEKDAERKRENLPLIEPMEKALNSIAEGRGKPCTRKFLFGLADELRAAWGKPAVDRAARRRKGSLIAWFCENCIELLTEQPPLFEQADADLFDLLAFQTGEAEMVTHPYHR
jgi:hypothetical protein